MRKSMPITSQPCFLCHSSNNKAFVRKLAVDLQAAGINVWFDEWEIRVGESLHARIGHGILTSGWFIVVLSTDSVASGWVQKELNAALSHELEQRGIFVLPVLLCDCEIPIFLRDKLYADFRKNYRDGLNSLLQAFGLERDFATHRVVHPCVVRSSTSSHHKIGSLLAGQTVKAIGKVGNWLQIAYFDFGLSAIQSGWIKSKYVLELEEAQHWKLTTYGTAMRRGV